MSLWYFPSEEYLCTLQQDAAASGEVREVRSKKKDLGKHEEEVTA